MHKAQPKQIQAFLMTVASLGLVFLVWFVSSVVIKPKSNNQPSPRPQVLQSQASSAPVTAPVKTSFAVNPTLSLISLEGTLSGKDFTAGLSNSSGSLEIDTSLNALKSGSISLDMATLDLGSSNPTDTAPLEKALKQTTSLDAETYPTATLVIKKVAPLPSPSEQNSEITADLTLKDKTLMIVFPAQIYVTDTGVQIDAILTLDTTLWGISSTSIDKDIVLNLKIVGE